MANFNDLYRLQVILKKLQEFSDIHLSISHYLAWVQGQQNDEAADFDEALFSYLGYHGYMQVRESVSGAKSLADALDDKLVKTYNLNVELNSGYRCIISSSNRTKFRATIDPVLKEVRLKLPGVKADSAVEFDQRSLFVKQIFTALDLLDLSKIEHTYRASGRTKDKGFFLTRDDGTYMLRFDSTTADKFFLYFGKSHEFVEGGE